MTKKYYFTAGKKLLLQLSQDKRIKFGTNHLKFCDTLRNVSKSKSTIKKKEENCCLENKQKSTEL